MIIEGALAVKAAILGSKRTVHQVSIDKNKESKDVDFIKRICKEKQISLELVSLDDVMQIATGKTHGGIVAQVSSRKSERPMFHYWNRVMLVEGIEDPFNLGTIIRTAKAAGCDAIITNDRDWKDSEATIIKSSAGASEAIQWIRVSSFTSILKQCKQNGFQIISAMRHPESVMMNDAPLTGKVCLCVGGEMRGLSKEVINQSNQFVMIGYPTNTKFALSAVSASAVLLFEMVRQQALLDKEQ